LKNYITNAIQKSSATSVHVQEPAGDSCAVGGGDSVRVSAKKNTSKKEKAIINFTKEAQTLA